MQFFIFLHTLTCYFQMKWGQRSLSLSLVSHIGICSVSFDFQTKKEKRRIQERKKCTQDEDVAIKPHIYTQKTRKKRTVIFKKRGKKEICSLFSHFLRVYEWWLKFFFYNSAFLQSCFFSLNQQYRMNEWLLSVVKKKSAHTRFPRVPFTSFNKTSCSLWVRKRKKI
jgi:hypothetical protein